MGNPTAAKFNPHHIPAGNGRESGQFTSAPDGEGDDSEKPQPAQSRGPRNFGKPPGGGKPPAPGPKLPNEPPPPIAPPILPPSLDLNFPDEAQAAIDAYRAQNNMPKGEGTVAHAKVDGQHQFGVNSTASGYTAADRSAADASRDALIQKDPNIMKSDNTGQKPNDALYHAEANLLMRTARENGGTLSGRTIEMRVDRNLCGSCDSVLPLISRELGNPTVIIRDPIRSYVLRNGSWAK